MQGAHAAPRVADRAYARDELAGLLSAQLHDETESEDGSEDDSDYDDDEHEHRNTTTATTTTTIEEVQEARRYVVR